MTADRRLNTWKEIGAFLDRNERTVKRWELERGLPVHRVPGGARGRVYAYAAELVDWLAKATPDADDASAEEPIGEAAAAPAPEAVGRPNETRRARMAGAALLGAAALAIGGGAIWSLRATPATARGPSEVELRGEYEWSRRTPESLGRAVDAFTQAIVADPRDARAYAGLSRCYNLLREFSIMPDAVAYPKAEAAARRAIALDDTLAGAHASLGFVAFYWSWRFAEGLKEFERAIALEPANGTWRQWRANALSCLGRHAEAVAEIDRAQALSPGSAAVMADRARIYAMAGRPAAALEILRAVEKAEPGLISAHVYMAVTLQALGDDAGFLRETRAAAALRGDADGQALAVAGERGLATGGRAGMLAAMAAAQRVSLAAGRGDEFRLAESYAAAGDAPRAVAALRRSLEKREPTLLGAKTESVFQPLAGNPGYVSVLRAIGFESVVGPTSAGAASPPAGRDTRYRVNS